jgi:hypothetical protein
MLTVEHLLCEQCCSLIAINQEEVMAAGPRRTGHMQSPKPESSALTMILARQQQACQGAVVLHEDLCQLCGSLIDMNKEEVMAAGPR